MGTLIPTTHLLKTGELITIRSAVSDDAAAMVALGRAVVAEGEFAVTHPDEFDLTEEQERDWIRQHLDDPGKLLLVAETSGEMIGSLFVESGSRKRLAHRGVLHMSVSRDWRSRGVGTALLGSLIHWAQAHPILEKLSLAVLATNHRAIGLYRKHEFVEEGRPVREIKFGTDQYVDDILMYQFV